MEQNSPLTARQITYIKSNMTRFMCEIYCADHHGSSGELCPKCRELCDYAVARVQKCRYAAENRPCPACPDCCFSQTMGPKLAEITGYMQTQMPRYSDKVMKIVSDAGPQ